MRKGILKDTLVYTSASFFSKGVGFIFIPFYTRLLSPRDYGIIDILNVFMAFSVVVFTGQLVQGVARFLPEMETESEKSLCASTTLIFVAMSFCIFLSISFLFSGRLSSLLLKDNDSAGIFQLSLPWIASSALLDICQSQLRFDLKAKQYAIASITVVIVSISSSILFVLGLRLGVRGFILGQTAGSFGGLIVSYACARHRYRLIISWKLLRNMLLFCLPLIPSSLSALLFSYIDRFLISNYLTIGDVGIYGMGARFASIATMLIVGINLALTPVIYATYKQDGTAENISRIFSILILALAPIIVGAILFSREILILMTTEKYYGAADVIPFIMAGAAISQLYNFAPGIFIAKKTYLIILINVVACLFNVGANVILIPRVGIIGAAVSNAATGLVIFLAYVTLGQREYKIPYKRIDIIIFALCILVPYVFYRFGFWNTNIISGRFITYKIFALVLIALVPAMRIASHTGLLRK